MAVCLVRSGGSSPTRVQADNHRDGKTSTTMEKTRRAFCFLTIEWHPQQRTVASSSHRRESHLYFFCRDARYLVKLCTRNVTTVSSRFRLRNTSPHIGMSREP